jgi:hypothetical protein
MRVNYSSHPCQQHSRRWRINVQSAIPILRSSGPPSYHFPESDIEESKGPLYPFERSDKTARYLFATHLSKYLSRVLIFCIFYLYNFHSIQRARAPLALRENKKKEPFFQSTSLIPTQSANTRKKTLQKHGTGTYEFQEGPRDCGKRVRPSSVKLISKESDFHHIYSHAPSTTRKQKREEMSVPRMSPTINSP